MKKTILAVTGAALILVPASVAWAQRPPRIEAPTGLMARAVSTNEIGLAWNDNADNETGYRVERAPAQTGPWQPVATVEADTRRYADTGLPAGSTHYYRVRAVRGPTGSVPSNVAAATTFGATPPATVGYIGCSMTVDAVAGYEAIGGTGFWPSAGSAFNGGGVTEWVDAAGSYWAAFDQLLAAQPDTRVIWWELCTHDGYTAEDLNIAIGVLDVLRQRVPDVVVYVSAQPGYTDGHVCLIAGSDGPARMRSLAEALVAGGYALAGPVMGPLGPRQLRDSCHANADGMGLMGGQLREFFDSAVANR